MVQTFGVRVLSGVCGCGFVVLVVFCVVAVQVGLLVLWFNLLICLIAILGLALVSVV